MQVTNHKRRRLSWKQLCVMVLTGLAIAFVLAGGLKKDNQQWNLNKTIGWGR